MYFVGNTFDPDNGGYKTITQATKQAEKKKMKVFDETGAQVYPEQAAGEAGAAQEQPKSEQAKKSTPEGEKAVEKAQESVETVTAIEATDEVPDGALEENPDGSVNTYNADGEKTGTVSKEEMEQLQAAAGELYERGAIGTVVVVRDGLVALRNAPKWEDGHKCGIAKTGYTAQAVGRFETPNGALYKLDTGKYISARPEDTKLITE